MMFTCTPLTDRLSFEADTITHTEEENKACSTLSSLPHKPTIDERKQKDRRDKKRKKGGRGGGGGGLTER